MYDKRLKIFVIICAVPFAAAVVRLAQMQLVSQIFIPQSLNEFQQNKAKPLRTVRGKILDRNGKLVAGNEPRFWLCINYNLTCFADERFWQAELVQTASQQGGDGGGSCQTSEEICQKTRSPSGCRSTSALPFIEWNPKRLKSGLPR